MYLIITYIWHSWEISFPFSMNASPEINKNLHFTWCPTISRYFSGSYEIAQSTRPSERANLKKLQEKRVECRVFPNGMQNTTQRESLVCSWGGTMLNFNICKYMYTFFHPLRSPNFLYVVKEARKKFYCNLFGVQLSRHGPKPGSHEAKAEALTLINLEAEALVTKPRPKPGYLYYTHLQKKSTVRGCISFCNQKDWSKSRSFGNPRSRSLWKPRRRSRSKAPKNLGSRSLDPKKAGFVKPKPKPALAHVWTNKDNNETNHDNMVT